MDTMYGMLAVTQYCSPTTGASRVCNTRPNRCIEGATSNMCDCAMGFSVTQTSNGQHCTGQYHCLMALWKLFEFFVYSVITCIFKAHLNDLFDHLFASVISGFPSFFPFQILWHFYNISQMMMCIMCNLPPKYINV